MYDNAVRYLSTWTFLACCWPSCTSNTPANVLNDYGVGGTGNVAVCRNYVSTQSTISQWEKLAPTGSVPQARFGVSAAYDAAHDTLIVFGGTDRATSYNDVRLLTHASGSTGAPAWSTLPVSGTPPPARSFALPAYNAASNALFIFGGVDGSNRIVTDLWKLTNASGSSTGGTWESLPVSGTAPNPVRTQMSSIYDEQHDMLVFFGGINCSASSCTQYNDTYAITGLLEQPTWSKLEIVGGAPPGRHLHSSAFDAANGRMIIFGGNSTTNPNGDANANLDDVWILSNIASGSSTWQQSSVSYAATVPALAGHTATYDASSDRMIVFGGTDTSNVVTDTTWILTGLNSSTQKWFVYGTGLPTPRSRTWHAAALAPANLNRMLVFGGHEGGTDYANDSWVLHNANGKPTAPVARIAVTSASTTVCATYFIRLSANATDSEGKELSGVIVSWTSSDPSIATIDQSGLVTAVSTGTVTLTATDETGSISGSTTITVTKPPTGNVSGTGGSSSITDCTCYCGWPENQVCQTNADCPADTSEPGTNVPGVCGCPIGC